MSKLNGTPASSGHARECERTQCECDPCGREEGGGHYAERTPHKAEFHPVSHEPEHHEDAALSLEKIRVPGHPVVGALWHVHEPHGSGRAVVVSVEGNAKKPPCVRAASKQYLRVPKSDKTSRGIGIPILAVSNLLVTSRGICKHHAEIGPAEHQLTYSYPVHSEASTLLDSPALLAEKGLGSPYPHELSQLCFFGRGEAPREHL